VPGRGQIFGESNKEGNQRQQWWQGGEGYNVGSVKVVVPGVGCSRSLS